ncbi:hypothetical protein D3C84_996630 [compost metagenome]
MAAKLRILASSSRRVSCSALGPVKFCTMMSRSRGISASSSRLICASVGSLGEGAAMAGSWRCSTSRMRRTSSSAAKRWRISLVASPVRNTSMRFQAMS